MARSGCWGRCGSRTARASLLGDHDLADEHLHRALEVNLAFGWEYHEATTLVALAQSRLRRTGVGDDEVSGWLDRADAIAGERGSDPGDDPGGTAAHR